jgi:hypothetical protein
MKVGGNVYNTRNKTVYEIRGTPTTNDTCYVLVNGSTAILRTQEEVDKDFIDVSHIKPNAKFRARITGAHIEVHGLDITKTFVSYSSVDNTLIGMSMDDFLKNFDLIDTYRPVCEHEFRLYVGLTEVYEYCLICDEKRKS